MNRNEGGSYKGPELVNEGGVGEDDEDRMGGKNGVFLYCVSQAQRITPPNPTKPNTV